MSDAYSARVALHPWVAARLRPDRRRVPGHRSRAAGHADTSSPAGASRWVAFVAISTCIVEARLLTRPGRPIVLPTERAMADQTPTPEPTTQNTEILRSRSHMMTRSRYFIAAAGVVATTLVIPPGASALSPSTKPASRGASGSIATRTPTRGHLSSATGRPAPADPWTRWRPLASRSSAHKASAGKCSEFAPGQSCTNLLAVTSGRPTRSVTGGTSHSNPATRGSSPARSFES